MVVCVLVDGDNISARFASKILEEAAKYGDVQIRRIYADAKGKVDWHESSQFRFLHAGTGKNAADILLTVEAMELLLTQRASHFVIVSSDGDYRHLALRLREHGAVVIGIGEEKAPPMFRNSCSKFIVIRSGQKAAVKTPKKAIGPKTAVELEVSPETDVGFSKMDLAICSIIKARSANEAGIKIQELSTQMQKVHQVKISSMPEKNWRAYLRKRVHLYAVDPKGPEAKVRYKPEGFAT